MGQSWVRFIAFDGPLLKQTLRTLAAAAASRDARSNNKSDYSQSLSPLKFISLSPSLSSTRYSFFSDSGFPQSPCIARQLHEPRLSRSVPLLS